MNAKGANGEVDGGVVINPQDCDMFHKGALDVECSDTGYREGASATEFLFPEMCSAVKRYVETRRDHLRSFGAETKRDHLRSFNARFFAADNH